MHLFFGQNTSFICTIYEQKISEKITIQYTNLAKIKPDEQNFSLKNYKYQHIYL